MKMYHLKTIVHFSLTQKWNIFLYLLCDFTPSFSKIINKIKKSKTLILQLISNTAQEKVREEKRTKQNGRGEAHKQQFIQVYCINNLPYILKGTIQLEFNQAWDCVRTCLRQETLIQHKFWASQHKINTNPGLLLAF